MMKKVLTITLSVLMISSVLFSPGAVEKVYAETGSEMTSGYNRTIPDGDYLIATAANSDKTKMYYLDIFGTDVPAKNGDNVDLAGPTNGDPAACEIWTLKYSNGFYSIKQKGTDMSLDVWYMSQENGANIGVSAYNGGSNQQWAISFNGTNGYTIQAKISGYCVDIQDWQITSGTNIQQCKSNSSDAQTWLFIPYKPAQTLEDGRYMILSAMDTNTIIDVPGNTGDIAEDTKVQTWHDYAENQWNSFDIKKLSNGYYRITHAASGKALDLTGGVSTTGTTVGLHTANNSIAQQWAITKDGSNGGYVIRAKCSGYTLGIPGSSTENKVKIAQAPINYSKSQTWQFVPAEFTVSYYANGGSGAPSPQTKYYMTNMNISSTIPTRDNYTFTGWNTKSDGTGSSYAPGDVFNLNIGTKLYAQWKSNHVWDAGTVTKKAGYTHTGTKVYKCTDCGATRTETIPKLNAAPVTPAKAKIVSAKVSNRKLTVKWNRVKAKTKGYQVAIKNKKTKKVKYYTVKASTKKTISKSIKLKKGTYAVMVRAFNKVNGETIYGAWSNVKSGKVK